MESEDSGGACRPLDVLRDAPSRPPGFRAELRAARRLPPGLPPACGRASCQSPAGLPLLGLRLLASSHAAPFLCNAHPLPANLNSPFNSRRRRRFSEELSLTVPSPHTTVPLAVHVPLSLLIKLRAHQRSPVPCNGRRGGAC